MSNTLNFEEFRLRIKKAFEKPLPGADAQHILAPIGRNSTDIQRIDYDRVNTAGVLALFIKDDNKPNLVLIERATYRGVHSGQIAFPGGRKEDEDKNYEETALRETEEEIGLPADNIEILGAFSPLYIPPSNFLVHPFAGIYSQKPKFVPQPSEVSRVIELDFNQLLHESSIRTQQITVRGTPMQVPAFYVDGFTIWGATAMMLSELRHMISNVK